MTLMGSNASGNSTIIQELIPGGLEEEEELHSIRTLLEENTVSDLASAACREHSETESHALHNENHSLPPSRKVTLDPEAKTLRIESTDHTNTVFVPFYSGFRGAERVEGIIPTSDDRTMVIETENLSDQHISPDNFLYHFAESEEFRTYDPEEEIISAGRHLVRVKPAMLPGHQVTDQMHTDFAQQLQDAEHAAPGVSDPTAEDKTLLLAGNNPKYGFTGHYSPNIIDGELQATFEADRIYELDYSLNTEGLSREVDNNFVEPEKKTRIFEELLEYASCPVKTQNNFEIGCLDTNHEALVYLQDNNEKEIDLIGVKSYNGNCIADIELSEKKPKLSNRKNLRSALRKEIIDESHQYDLGASLADIAANPQRGRISKQPGLETDYNANGKTVEIRDFCFPQNKENKKRLKQVYDFNYGKKGNIRLGYTVI